MHHSGSDISKYMPITCFLTSPVRSTQEDDPEGVLKEAVILGLDACAEKGLYYSKSEVDCQCLRTDGDSLSSQ